MNLLTLDIISSTAFGLNSDVQRRAQGDFAQNAFLLTNSSEVNASFSEKIRVTFVVAMTRKYNLYQKDLSEFNSVVPFQIIGNMAPLRVFCFSFCYHFNSLSVQ